MSRAGDFFREKVVAPLLGQLKQGVTPRRLAVSVALGLCIGLFPLVGTTTAICLAAGYFLRLNHPALQVANHCMYPFQIPMVLVFVRLGEKLYGAPPAPLAPAGLAREFAAGPAAFLRTYGKAGIYGVSAWALLAPFLALVLYASLAPLFGRMAKRGRRA